MKPYYEDEHATVYHGDWRDVAPSLDAGAFGVLLTDPPYGDDYRSGKASPSGMARSIAGDKDTAERDAALAWWGDGPALVFGTWKVERPAATRARLIWDAMGVPGMGALDLPWKPADQEIYVLGHGFHGHRGNNVLRFPPVQLMAKNGRTHPHEKPVDLLLALLKKCPEGPVLDLFGGTGSTAVAAKMLGRAATVVELDEAYCEVAAQRLSQGVLDLGAA